MTALLFQNKEGSSIHSSLINEVINFYPSWKRQKTIGFSDNFCGEKKFKIQIRLMLEVNPLNASEYI